MNTTEMHVWFRQYAQQMGMQNVRAILPEQIDVLINTSIKDTIDEIINANVGTTNDRIITDNAKLANINALRTLYKVNTLDLYDVETLEEYKNEPYTFTSERVTNAMYFVDFSVRYATDDVDSSEYYLKYKDYYDEPVSDRELTADEIALIQGDTQLENTTFNEANKQALISVYKTYITSWLKTNKKDLSKWFPIRIIDDSYLADVLNDWVLAPRLRTPVMVVYALDDSVSDSRFEVYFGDNDTQSLKTILSSKRPVQIRCSYIKKPNQVKYLSDIGLDNVDSDLPEQLHIPMLKHAVDLYRASIQGATMSEQRNQQANQQELARNNQRPVNEGYQS